jgi:iron(III) transport system substrate-binding protein
VIHTRTRLVGLLLIVAMAVVFSAGCGATQKVVVCYTSVDEEYAQPVFQAFETVTGIHVLPVYDTEAAKTTGLVNRLVAEQAHPTCDVFWNNETTQMSILKQDDILRRLPDDAGQGILASYRDPDDLWAGHAARFRVLLINTKVLKGPRPSSVLDLASSAYPRGIVGMAMPLFGTTAAHAAALYAALGDTRARSFFQHVSAAGVRIVDGNATVRDLVAQGTLMWGITDSDDALVAIKRGDPVSVIVPDQKGIGTLIIPSAVAVIRGDPHAGEADSLARYLLTEEVESTLMQEGYCQLSTRQKGGIAPLTGTSVKGMDVDSRSLLAAMATSKADLTSIFGQ